MAEKKQAESKGPEVLDLVLENQEIQPWEPTIIVDGYQIAGASDKTLKQMRDNIEQRIKDEVGDKTFSEIAEVQRILKARPLKRDDKGKPVLQKHPQLGIETVVEKPFDIEEQRPRNRLLWHIEDLLKGKKAKDVKKITLQFHVTADLKQPKWEDAIFLAELVKYATDEHSQLGYWIVDFADKFAELKDRTEKLVKTK